MTPREFADRMNRMTPEEVAQAMERSPTHALEWGVGFEALSHRSPSGDRNAPDQYGFRDAGDVKAAVDELVRMGVLVTVFDPECGEDRYCTPDVRDSLVAQGKRARCVIG